MAIALSLVPCSASAIEVRVDMLSGETIRGELLTLADDRLELSVFAEENASPGVESIRRSVMLSEVLAVQCESNVPTEPAEDDGEAGKFAELLDGSQVALKDFQLTSDQLIVQRPPIGADASATLQIARQQVKRLVLVAPTESTARQWRELLTALPANDVLVVRRNANIDFVDGVIKTAADDVVQFELGGDTIPVKREKVAGLVFYRRQAASAGRPANCVLETVAGDRLSLARLELSQEGWQVETEGGVPLQLPTSSVTRLDFSQGKLVYLSDLRFRQETVEPLTPWPTAAQLAIEADRVRKDRGFLSPQAALLDPTIEEGQVLGFRRVIYPKAIAMRARSQIRLRVPPGFRTLQAEVGLEASAASIARCRLKIETEASVLVDRELKSREPIVRIRNELSNAQWLTITVDYAGAGDVGDRCVLGNARLTK